MSHGQWRLAITCPPSTLDQVALRLVGLTGQGVEEAERDVLVTMLDAEREAEAIRDLLLAEFPKLTSRIESVPSVDWSHRWREGIVARRFGPLLVTPSWIPAPMPPAGPVLVLDPESAFGSGEHGSTRTVLTLMVRHFTPGQTVLDLGSGSGILAIAAALLGASRAIGVEVDAEALPIAEANALRNGVAATARFIEGDAGLLLPLLGPAEIICSNILRTINADLVPKIAQALAPRGVAIFGGMEDGEAALFRPELAAAGLVVVDEAHDSGWWGVAARRG